MFARRPDRAHGIAGWGRYEGEQLVLTGRVLNSAGTARLEVTQIGTAGDAEALGQSVANALLEQGAAALIAECRG